MFGLFKKDPIKKLTKEHQQIMEKAVHAQRNGNIELYGELSFEADKIYKKIEELKKEQKSNAQ